LNKLCTELGHPLDDKQIEEALKDLDVNKDGVIDLDEFCTWWFSGF
jgi:Ca2+-binding EF-hand superfamily protein